MMGLLSTLMLAVPLVLQMAAVEGSGIPLNVQQAASETELAGIIEAPTDFVPDGKTCCPSNLKLGNLNVTSKRYEYLPYVSANVSPHAAEVQTCCFDAKINKFWIHYLDLTNGKAFPVNVGGSAKQTWGFCNLELTYNMSIVNASDHWISGDLDLTLDAGCGTERKSVKRTVTIFLDRNYHLAGSFIFDYYPLTVKADVLSKIIGGDANGGGGIGLQVHLAKIGGLNATVEFTIENNTLKEFLKTKKICK